MLTKNTVDAFVADMKAELNKLAKKHGLHLGSINTRFNSDNFKSTISFARLDENNAPVPRELTALRAVYPEYENAQVMLNNKKYVLIGFNSRSRKYPFIGKDERGKIWKLPRVVLDNVVSATGKK